MRAIFLAFAFLFGLTAPAPAAAQKRVALVIGQNAYPGGSPEVTGLPTLDNPVPDAKSMVELLAGSGFDVISCDGKQPGCFDLDRAGLVKALDQLKARAASADLALVYFAGHGVASDEGNMLAPTDAKVNCQTGAIGQGVPVELLLKAAAPAKNKFLILDACRDNPLGEICPGLKGKKLSFTRIEVGALQGLLLVTSTQFGQTALDGLSGAHSPFANALLAGLKANPNIYFEQVMNEVARATYEDAQAHFGFLQIPGQVIGGAAPADCLAGKDCIGDARMAALSAENGQLASDAAGLRSLLADEERTRGKPYTAEERKTRVAALQATLTSIGRSNDPLRQEARRRIDAGDVAGGEAKLDEALDADEKALAEVERLKQERSKAAARSARDLAVLASGKDVLKALGYYRRATRLDASDAEVWNDYAHAASDAGRTEEAKTAYMEGERAAKASNSSSAGFWAVVGLGYVAVDQGDLPAARRLYDKALAIAEFAARADPGEALWQRNLSVSYSNLGDVQVAQGNLAGALDYFKRTSEIQGGLAKAGPGNAQRQSDLSLSYEKVGNVLKAQGDLAQALQFYQQDVAITERLAKADPGNAQWQRNLSVSYAKVGDAQIAQGDLPGALDNFKQTVEIQDRLAKADPGNAEWQRDLSVSYNKVGDVLIAQGNLPEALKSFQGGLAIADRLAKADPNNAGWQLDLSVSYNKVGDVLVARGNLPKALKSFQDSLAIRHRLAKADPNNAGWQRDLSVSYDRVGDVLVAQGNLPEALKSFQGSLAIRDRLAKADPDNAGWQYDLGLSNERIGDVQMAQGELAAALKSYQAKKDIISRLTEAGPNNAGWQRDLSLSYEKIGDVLKAQGDLGQALQFYRQDLAITDRLAKADPNNAGWRSDLSVSNNKVGDVLVAQGNLPEALKSFQAGLAIVDHLAKADPGNAQWQRDLAGYNHNVGVILGAQGNLSEALKFLQGSLAIRDHLAKADPGNAEWQHDLSLSHAALADIYRRQGQWALAKDALGKGRETIARMTALSPDNAKWKRDLAWFEARIAALEVEAAFGAGDYARAAAAEAKLAEAKEKAEREKAGKAGPETASGLLELSWYRLFARDFRGALAASDRAIAIEPGKIVHATNKAHALMFLGRAREARALYLRYKGQRVAEGGKLWEEAILDDFKEFEKRGLKHRRMAEIKALLAAPAPAR